MACRVLVCPAESSRRNMAIQVTDIDALCKLGSNQVDPCRDWRLSCNTDRQTDGFSALNRQQKIIPSYHCICTSLYITTKYTLITIKFCSFIFSCLTNQLSRVRKVCTRQMLTASWGEPEHNLQ